MAEELELDDEIVAEASAGAADADAGRFVKIGSPEDAAALHERTMMRLQDRMAFYQG